MNFCEFFNIWEMIQIIQIIAMLQRNLCFLVLPKFWLHAIIGQVQNSIKIFKAGGSAARRKVYVMIAKLFATYQNGKLYSFGCAYFACEKQARDSKKWYAKRGMFVVYVTEAQFDALVTSRM